MTTKVPVTMQEEIFYHLNSANSGADVNTVQSLFGVGVTLEGSTIYEIEMAVQLPKTSGANAHTIALGFGGTATFNSFRYFVHGGANTSSASPVAGSNSPIEAFISTASASVLTGSIASANSYFMAHLRGIVSVNAAGTLIPQYTLSAAPGGAYNTAVGSFVRLRKLGASGANINLGGWA